MRYLLAFLLLISLCSLRKKKRGAILHSSVDYVFKHDVQNRFLQYRLNFSPEFFAAKINFNGHDVRMNFGKPNLILPKYSSDDFSEYFQYLNIDAINSKKHYPGMILNRPVPFNNAFLKKNFLQLGVNLPF